MYLRCVEQSLVLGIKYILIDKRVEKLTLESRECAVQYLLHSGLGNEIAVGLTTVGFREHKTGVHIPILRKVNQPDASDIPDILNGRFHLSLPAGAQSNPWGKGLRSPRPAQGRSRIERVVCRDRDQIGTRERRCRETGIFSVVLVGKLVVQLQILNRLIGRIDEDPIS